MQPTIQFYQPGVYHIGRVICGFVEEKKAQYDAKKNLLINGDAEAGFQYTASPCAPMCKAYDGKSRNHVEQSMSSLPRYAIDTEVAHSGNASFRIEADEKPIGPFEWFSFDPVKYILREPLTFSVWMKSAQDDFPVYIGIRMSTWKAYQTQVRVSRQWRKYSITIPSFGDPAPGIECYSVQQVLKEELCYGFPQVILCEPGTLWVDDAVVQLAQHTDEHPLPDYAIRGKLDVGKSYYFAGEVIKPQLEIVSPTEQTAAKLSWRMSDFEGRIVASGDLGSHQLPWKLTPEILPPEKFRGPGTLSFTATALDGSRCVTRNFYFGVIGARAPLCFRMGAQPDNPNRANVPVQLDMLGDFRIGSMRSWMSYGNGIKNLKETYQGRGFDLMVVMENLSLREPDRNLLFWDYSEFLSDLTPHIKNLKGVVSTWELFNEPNIRNFAVESGASVDFKKYRLYNIDAVGDTIRQVGRGIHQVDPKAKVAGPTPVPTSPSYIAAVLEHGGSSELNVVTEHAYRKLPELPDYGEDIAIVCENIRKQGKKMPVWSTESCLETPALLPYETIPPDVVETAARDIRIPLVGFANGLERYYHFATSVLAQPATTFLDLILGGPETDGLPRPGLYLYAARALIDLIGDAPCTARVRLGADCRGYIFDCGRERVAAVWKWDGEPLTVSLPKDIVVYDMMGQEREPGSVTLSTRPHYLKSALSAAQLCKVLEESMSRHGAAKCEFSIRIIDEMRVAVEVSNRGAAVLEGTLAIQDNGLLSEQPRDIAIHVEGEKTQSIELHLGQPLAVKAPELQLTLRTNDGQVIEQSLPVSALLVPRCDNTIKADGDLSDWPANAASLKLDYSNHVAFAKEQWTAEEKAITGEIRMYWNEKSLNIAFILNKPVFMPYSGEKETFWEGDSIQFVLDALKNARPDTMELQDDDYVYCLAGNTAMPIVQREVASSPMHDSLVKEIGRIKEVSLGIKAEPGRVVYEASFPTRAVSPLLLAAGRTAGFSAIFNLTDGQSRIGWLEIAPGVGQWPRSPAKYLTIVLKK